MRGKNDDRPVAASEGLRAATSEDKGADGVINFSLTTNVNTKSSHHSS
jgi:hypothetical protein